VNEIPGREGGSAGGEEVTSIQKFWNFIAAVSQGESQAVSRVNDTTANPIRQIRRRLPLRDDAAQTRLCRDAKMRRE